ncbi:MAG TPA: RsmE family RNA methyltransferase, partial [Tepidisphaeraceae bacterium]|nr:RsmE family RNA methyltransferase [Tepidisphaeraceae bacterium]
TLLIGPEGGWTDKEMAMFREAGLTGVRMGGTILRIETAAVAAAAIVAAMVAPHFSNKDSESA